MYTHIYIYIYTNNLSGDVHVHIMHTVYTVDVFFKYSTASQTSLKPPFKSTTDSGFGWVKIYQKFWLANSRCPSPNNMLVGGLNPSKTYLSTGMIILNILENKIHVPNHQYGTLLSNMANYEWGILRCKVSLPST